jgi:uncharacterized protein DUF6941
MLNDVFELRSFLVCDDVRREITGKEILIGVYADAMVFPAFPATIRQIVFRVSGVVSTKEATEIAFRIEDENGNPKGEAAGTMPAAAAPRHVTFAFAFENVTFDKPDTLVAHFRIGKEMGKVGAIVAKSPQNEEERRRTSPLA